MRTDQEKCHVLREEGWGPKKKREFEILQGVNIFQKKKRTTQSK